MLSERLGGKKDEPTKCTNETPKRTNRTTKKYAPVNSVKSMNWTTKRMNRTTTNKGQKSTIQRETKHFVIPPNSNELSDWAKTCHVSCVETF